MNSQYDTLVLSAGGLNGVAMLGSLQYCFDNSMISNIQKFVGTSVGSIICYLVIIGYTPIEIVVNLCIHSELFDKISDLNIHNAMTGDGAVSFSHIAEHLEKMTIDKVGRLFTIKELEDEFHKQFACVTYNLSKSIPEYVQVETHPNLNCIDALRMSCNLPFIFDHFVHNDCYYIDGGVYDSFPIEFSKKMGGVNVLGICLCGLFKPPQETISNIGDYLFRILCVILNANAIKSIESCNSVDKDGTPPTLILLKDYSHQNIMIMSMNSKTKLEMFSAGYDETKKQFQNFDK